MRYYIELAPEQENDVIEEFLKEHRAYLVKDLNRPTEQTDACRLIAAIDVILTYVRISK